MSARRHDPLRFLHLFRDPPSCLAPPLLFEATGPSTNDDELFLTIHLVQAQPAPERSEMPLTHEEAQAKLLEFKVLCDPLIKWLNDNHNPHFKIVIDNSSAELLSGEMAYPNHEFWRD